MSTSTLAVGDAATATAAGLDQHGAPIALEGVAWSTTAPSIVRVASSGAIVALAPGQATIIAQAGAVEGMALLTVTAIPVASVTLSLGKSALDVGATTQAVAVPVDGRGGALSDRTVTFATSNANVATVSSTGVVTAIAQGTTTVVANSEGKSASVPLTVNVPVLTTAGGMVRDSTGTVTLVIPPGAVSQSTPITIATYSGPTPAVAMRAFDLGPSGASFGQPVTMTVAVDPTRLALAGPRVTPILALKTGNSWTMVEGSTYDQTTGRLSAPLQHFSTYGVIIMPWEVLCGRAIGRDGYYANLFCDPPPPDLVRDTVNLRVGQSLYASVLLQVTHIEPTIIVSGVIASCQDTITIPGACVPWSIAATVDTSVAKLDAVGAKIHGRKAGTTLIQIPDASGSSLIGAALVVVTAAVCPSPPIAGAPTATIQAVTDASGLPTNLGNVRGAINVTGCISGGSELITRAELWVGARMASSLGLKPGDTTVGLSFDSGSDPVGPTSLQVRLFTAEHGDTAAAVAAITIVIAR